MTEGFSFDNVSSPAPQKPGGMGCFGKIAIGCLVLFILLLGITWYAVSHWQSFVAAPILNKLIDETLKNSKLVPEEEAKMRAAFNPITERLQKNSLSGQEIQNLIENFAKGPLMMLIFFKGFEMQHIENSGLPAEEKTLAKLQLERILRGWSEKKVTQQHLEDLSNEVPRNLQNEFKEKLTDSEVQKVIAKAKEIADELQIPEEIFKVDIAEEISKIVQDSLKASEGK
jgi:hypothetical protein